MAQDKPESWVDELAIENANIKWAFSRFDGREDDFNEEGNHNFVVIIDPREADRLRDVGWNVKEKPGREDGEPPENHLTVKFGSKGVPMVYFVKGEGEKRRIYAIDHPSELKEIRQDSCENIDVIISPSFWSQPGGKHGISAYVKEMYVTIRESRFASKYLDAERI